MSLKPLRLLLVLAVLLVLPLSARLAEAADLKGALDYVPKDAVGAMTVDVDGLRPTPLFKKVVGQLVTSDPKAQQKLTELKQKTGFDVLEHVHAVVVAAGAGFPKNDDDLLIIAEAKLDEARLVAFMKKEGAKLTAKSDTLGKYYLFDDGDGAMAFRGKYVVIGGIDIFRRALKKEGPSAQLSAALQPNLKKHLAFALIPNQAMRDQLKKEMPEAAQLKVLSGSAHLQNGLQIQSVATFTTAAPAAKLAKQGNDALSQVKGDEQMKRMGLDGLLDRIKIRADRSDLRLDITLTQADLDKLTKLAEQFL